MKSLGQYIVALLDRLAAMTMTLTIVMTFLWPFMEDGFWSEKLVYLWMGTGLSLVWAVSPIILVVIKLAYKDWKLLK